MNFMHNISEKWAQASTFILELCFLKGIESVTIKFF